MTEQQSKLLAYLRQYIGEKGYAPCFDEIMAHMHLRSKSGIHRIMTALETRGFIRRDKHRARAIELSDKKCPHCGGALPC